MKNGSYAIITYVVTEYMYLGLLFTTKLSTSCMQKNLATTAKTALIKVDRALRQLPNASIDIFQKISDSRIAPILLYGSEIWGMDNCNIIEGTHLFALKRVLNVPIITPNVFVYGDTGKHELYEKKCIVKYQILDKNFKYEKL